MGITILPRDYNPWVQALPTFIQNMALQKMSEKFRARQAGKLEDERRQDKIRDLQIAGYTEVDAEKPDVMVGATGLKEAEYYTKNVNIPGVGVQAQLYQRKHGQTTGRLKEAGAITKFTAGRKAPSAIQQFEIVAYGGPAPMKRGTPSYKAKYLGWIKSQKEQSSYVPAFINAQERKLKADSRREGTKLRTEFNAQTEVKQFSEFRLRNDVMNEALKRAEQIDVLKKGTMVAVDQAVITTFNKMTDPDSVVRESEYARTAHDLAMWNRLKGKVEKWKRGGAGLTMEDRRALRYMANRFYAVAEGKYVEKLDEYHGYLKTYELDPEKHIKTPKWVTEKGGDMGAKSDEELLRILE